MDSWSEKRFFAAQIVFAQALRYYIRGEVGLAGCVAPEAVSTVLL
jgi:hypothetical protein